MFDVFAPKSMHVVTHMVYKRTAVHIQSIFLYVLESLYMRIYTCCDNIDRRAKHAESIRLVFLPFRFHNAPPQFREPYKTSLWEKETEAGYKRKTDREILAES